MSLGSLASNPSAGRCSSPGEAPTPWRTAQGPPHVAKSFARVTAIPARASMAAFHGSPGQNLCEQSSRLRPRRPAPIGSEPLDAPFRCTAAANKCACGQDTKQATHRAGNRLRKSLYLRAQRSNAWPVFGPSWLPTERPPASPPRITRHHCKSVCAIEANSFQSPYRLVVRTSRCGRDNPGSTPGKDIFPMVSSRSAGQHNSPGENSPELRKRF